METTEVKPAQTAPLTDEVVKRVKQRLAWMELVTDEYDMPTFVSDVRTLLASQPTAAVSDERILQAAVGHAGHSDPANSEYAFTGKELIAMCRALLSAPAAQQPSETARNILEDFAKGSMPVVHFINHRGEQDAISLRELQEQVRSLLRPAAQEAEKPQPNLIDFHNGDAAIWIENGEVKAEWNAQEATREQPADERKTWLLAEAREISTGSPSKDIRAFAESVIDFLAEKGERNGL